MSVTIKKECEELYQMIKDAQNRLEQLRDICKHTKKFEGNWSYRIGNIQPAEICSHCGKLIKYL